MSTTTTEDNNFFIQSSYLLRGPLTLTVFILGVVFNSIAIYNLTFVTSTRRQCKLQSDRVFKNITENSITPLMSPSIRSHFNLYSNAPRIYVYFLWLTICDTTLLLSAVLTYSLPTMFFGFTGFYAYFIPICYVCSNATFTASVWLILALMVERYRALGRTFKKAVRARASSQQRTSIHKKLLLLSSLAFVYALPRYFELSIVYSEKLQTVVLVTSSLIHNSIYIIVYRICGSLLCYSAVPYFVAIFLSLKIYYVIKQSRTTFLRSSAKEGQSKKRLRESEKFLLILCARFLLSRSITTVLDISEHLIGSQKFLNSPKSLFAVDLSNFIVVLTSFTNFFILFAFSQNFRLDVFACFKRNNDEKNNECI